jgi:serine protease AprX
MYAIGGTKVGDRVEVIVQYKVTPTEAHHQRVAALGGRLNAKMDFIKGAHYTVPSSALATLAEDPDVAYITPNRPIKPTFDNITNGTIDAGYMNGEGYVGTGVGVAIIDSGIVDLPDFHTGSTDRIVYQQSFVGGTPADQYGHGTHVAGILAGNGNGTIYQGVAYNANLINLRVLDANGNGTDSET